MRTIVKVTQPGTLLPVLVEAEIMPEDVDRLVAEIRRMRDGSLSPGQTRRQGEDGVPHMTFYDVERQMSFVWDGSQGDKVEVSVGGYGEPVAAEFDWILPEPPSWSVVPNVRTLRGFEQVCKAWMEAD